MHLLNVVIDITERYGPLASKGYRIYRTKMIWGRIFWKARGKRGSQKMSFVRGILDQKET